MKKGFTLVELIAVLVILGLISLITIPTVNNNLKKYKQSLFNDSIKNIEQTAKNWGADNIGKLPNSSTSKKRMIYPNIDTEQDFSILQIRVKDLQEAGYINSEIKNPMTNTNFCNCAVITITKTNTGYTYKVLDNEYGIDLLKSNASGCMCDESIGYQEYYTGTKNEVSTIYYNPVTNTKCSASESVSTPGTNTGCMKWYAIEDSDYTKSTVDVILDHNITDAVAWDASGSNAEMKEASTALTTAISTWHTDVKQSARVITADEIATITKNITFKKETSPYTDYFYFDTNSDLMVANSKVASNYSWLYDYTTGCTEYGCKVAGSTHEGYWTSSAVFDSTNRAWYVDRKGCLSYYFVGNTTYMGVRPVVTISKDIIK